LQEVQVVQDNFSLDSVLTRERSILKNVYMWMAAGLALTGIVALGIASNPRYIGAIFSNRMIFFGIFIAQIGIVMYLSARINTMSAGAATMGFAAYAALNGVTMSVIFLAYTGTSIAATFFITAGTFAAMSVYAVTTRRDLSGISSYLMMGLGGIIIASLVNLFLKSPGFDWLISFVGVAVFVGLTAYDTQIIKRWNSEVGAAADETVFVRVSIMGALKLYLDFINLFLFLLRFFGRRRN
jgi:FtsH-binding integral membrane protein